MCIHNFYQTTTRTRTFSKDVLPPTGSKHLLSHRSAPAPISARCTTRAGGGFPDCSAIEISLPPRFSAAGPSSLTTPKRVLSPSPPAGLRGRDGRWMAYTGLEVLGTRARGTRWEVTMSRSTRGQRDRCDLAHQRTRHRRTTRQWN